MLLYSLLALFLIASVNGQAGTLPRLPTGFTVDIEANLLDSNLTLNTREYYNQQLGFQRIEINTVDSYIYTITNYNTKEVYTITNNVACSSAPLGTDTFSTARSVEDILLFGDKYIDSYTGVFTVRGVPCDSWLSHISFVTNGTVLANGTTVGAGVLHNFTLQYYFTVPSWGFRAANVTRKPMRTVLNGTRTYPNGTIQYIVHNYEFVNFVPAPPAIDYFELPAACVGYPAQVLNILKTSTGSGLAAGMFFLGLFIGAGITGISIWVYCRRRQLARDRFAKSNSLAMQENIE